MPSMFATTGGTTSSTLLTGLAAGKSYTYSVRCADTSGNATTSDYTVAFSVAAASSPLPPTPPPTTTPAPTALGVTVNPASGSGTAQAFSFQISDPAGYSGVKQLDIFIGKQVGGASNCRVQWNGGTTLFLQNDAASAWTSGAAGASATLSNSQCSIAPAGFHGGQDERTEAHQTQSPEQNQEGPGGVQSRGLPPGCLKAGPDDDRYVAPQHRDAALKSGPQEAVIEILVVALPRPEPGSFRPLAQNQVTDRHVIEEGHILLAARVIGGARGQT